MTLFPVKELEKYLVKLIHEKGESLNEAELKLLDRHLKRVRFYLTIEKFGYKMMLKPVKTFFDAEGLPTRKANCDVDMAFFLMRDRKTYESSCDPVWRQEVLPAEIFARRGQEGDIYSPHASRTAKEIKRFAGDKFLDFAYLRERLKRTDE